LYPTPDVAGSNFITRPKMQKGYERQPFCILKKPIMIKKREQLFRLAQGFASLGKFEPTS
jgi:hypothetical protein